MCKFGYLETSLRRCYIDPLMLGVQFPIESGPPSYGHNARTENWNTGIGAALHGYMIMVGSWLCRMGGPHARGWPMGDVRLARAARGEAALRRQQPAWPFRPRELSKSQMTPTVSGLLCFGTNVELCLSCILFTSRICGLYLQ